jgi:hypothetical protein
MMTILGSRILYGLRRYFTSALFCVGLTLASAQLAVLGQTAEPATPAQTTESAPAVTAEAQGQTEANAPIANEETKLTDDEIDQLTSRIALYPDPLLELTLQAAIFPLQVVQASRFLEKHAEDPNLKPDPNWDSSVLGLLNYPVVIEAMNDDLDWTENLGQAVVNQLPDVQDSIQQFRSELYAGGVLASNDKQRVIVSKDVIAILPADAEIIYVPQYDAMAAVTPAAAVGAEEATETAGEITTAETTAVEPEATAQAGATTAAPAGTEYATAEPGTAAAPVYSSAPVAAAPPVAYSNPYPSFWSSAAVFLGGAAIGGLIGYGFGDDDDDGNNNNNNDGGNNWSRDVNIEDSNIVINRDDDRVDARRGDVRQNDVQGELRRRQNLQPAQNVQQQRRATPARATASTRVAQGNQPQRQAATASQNRQISQQKQAAAKRRPGDTAAKPSNAGALSGSKSVPGKQAKAESRRGAQSRAASTGKSPTSQMSAKRPQQQALPRPSSGSQVQRQTQRGKQSGGGRKR